MTSRDKRVLAIGAAIAVLLTAFPIAVERTTPRTGLVRTFFAQVGFGGVPVEERTSEINLRFLDEQPNLPRQNFSARWRGFFYLAEPQTVEFFAGGNDEVELRVDGETLIRRSLGEGLRTIGRRVRLEAGSHALAIDYQQFGGSMALNIQRSLEGQTPSPFLPGELFSDRATAWHVSALSLARRIRPIVPYAWMALVIGFVAIGIARNLSTWRTTGAPRSGREYAQRLWPFVVPALLAPAIVFALGPHTIFRNNTGEFAVQYGELAMPWLLRTVAINWVLLVAIGCVLAVISVRVARMYTAVIFAGGLLLWGQGNLWNADYGVLAGQDLDLAQHAWRAPYELIGWAIAITVALVFYRPISRIAPFASLVFLSVQGAAVAFSGVESALAQRVRWVEPPPEIFQFSSTQNVIHIVLDEFQSDLFHDIYQQERAALDRQFSGFQYFADHAGSFPTTSFSMPAMLAGREYRNQQPAPQFVRDAFKQSSIFATVAQAGYDIDATTIVPIDSFEQWMGPENEPNWKGARFRIRKPYVSRDEYREVTARQLAELSWFRHVPHAAKELGARRPTAFYRPIWMDRTETPAEVRQHEASNSVAFLEQFAELMSVGRSRPVYKLLHVGVPHRPIVVDAACRFLGVTPITRLSYRDQCRCAIRLVGALLDRARQLGVYDSSLIVVSSDHGTDLPPWGFHGESESLFSTSRGPAVPRLGAIAGTAKALMLIKPPNRTGPIAVSDAPTSHVDVPPTIVELLGLAREGGGTSMFRLNAAQARTRFYGMYDVRQRFPKEYLDRIHVLTIDRKVVDASGWNFTQTMWPPNASLPAGDVDFLTSNTQYYLGTGWSIEREESSQSGGRVTFVQPVVKRAVLFAPATAREIAFRARTSENGFVGVAIDGQPAERLTVSAGDYRDYVIQIASSAPGPSIRSVTLSFDALPDGGRTFKLDRLTIR